MREQLEVVALVPCARGHEADAAVEMLGVVPAHERSDPGSGRIEAGEWLRRVARAVLQRPEERLGEGIVVADTRTAERRQDAEPLEGGEHGGALHRAAVVGM